MPTIQIDRDANALVMQHVTNAKMKATLEGKPTKRISKNKLVSDLIKTVLGSKKRAPKPEIQEAARGE